MADTMHNGSITTEILKRSLVIEKNDRYILYCRTPKDLAYVLDKLVAKFPEKFPNGDLLVDWLYSLDTVRTLEELATLREDPYFDQIYKDLAPFIAEALVHMPAKEGLFKSGRRAANNETCPPENLYMFGIELPGDDHVGYSNSLYGFLKQCKLPTCNVAKIEKGDKVEEIIVDRLLKQDNQRPCTGK